MNIREQLPSRGADENTPSRAQYFSWINNTWEGSTEAQTLVNLDFFGWLRDEYGMVLDIYAFDSGNIDTGRHYGSTASAAFRRQFPRGFRPIRDKAESIGCRLGMWLGPDGFGNSLPQQRRRFETVVGLCRDHDFALLKLDACCGGLRPQKRPAFIRMLKACRLYCPDLIVLNHRIDLGEAEPYVTTFLFEGAETYIDVHMGNDYPPAKTATHNRAGALSRRLVPGLKRLTEDHGVCLSSCLDYWDDDLILQAFNRCLILAPEIYGNPWLLRDDELPKLARIYNLHRRFRDILVRGKVLPKVRYGPYAVSRGDGCTRFVTLRNLTWKPTKYKVKLGTAIGLAGGRGRGRGRGEVELRRLHPSERIIGRFPLGTDVPVEVLPFRACLLVASTKPSAEVGVVGCDYEVVRDTPGKPVILKLLGMPGCSASVCLAAGQRAFSKATLDGKSVPALLKGKAVRVSFPGKRLARPWHRKLAGLRPVPVPPDAEALYEATCFAADNNALEVRSLHRSGPSSIPEVRRARDAFFSQARFVELGIWDRNLFDGRSDTRFNQVLPWGYKPAHGGALRVDFGRPIRIDRLVLRGPGIALGSGEPLAEVSADLKTWRPAALKARKGAIVAEIPAGRAVRYFRMRPVPAPLARVEGYRGKTALDRSAWRASNLFEPYAMTPAVAAWSASFTLDEAPKGSYLAIALPGRHGVEGAFAAVRVAGRPVGAPNRATSFPANVWEAPVRTTDGNYTYYVPVTSDMIGKPIDAVVLVLAGGVNEIRPEVWITAYPIPLEARELVLTSTP